MGQWGQAKEGGGTAIEPKLPVHCNLAIVFAKPPPSPLSAANVCFSYRAQPCRATACGNLCITSVVWSVKGDVEHAASAGMAGARPAMFACAAMEQQTVPCDSVIMGCNLQAGACTKIGFSAGASLASSMHCNRRPYCRGNTSAHISSHQLTSPACIAAEQPVGPAVTSSSCGRARAAIVTAPGLALPKAQGNTAAASRPCALDTQTALRGIWCHDVLSMVSPACCALLRQTAHLSHDDAWRRPKGSCPAPAMAALPKRGNAQPQRAQHAHWQATCYSDHIAAGMNRSRPPFGII
jgi:hypothetical protein